MPTKANASAEKRLVIAAPRLGYMKVDIEGTAPYVQHKFSHKTLMQMLETQMAGSRSKSRRVREERDPEQDYEDATHFTADGKCGIPAPAFRSAMISACRLVGFQMTKAKLSIFVEADSLDVDEGTPLVFIEGERQRHDAAVRLEGGVASVAVRPMWKKWTASVRVIFDQDQFDFQDIGNLFARAGAQVGIGEGRPDSKKSHGMGWGTFRVVGFSKLEKTT